MLLISTRARTLGKHSPGIQWKLRIQNAALDRELFKEQFEAITPVDFIDE